MQLPIFIHQFRYILDWLRSVGSCGISNVFELVVGFGIRLYFVSDFGEKPLGKKTMEHSE
jgi:hypothetical protein